MLVGRSFPLSAAVEAHRFLEENTLKGAGARREGCPHGGRVASFRDVCGGMPTSHGHFEGRKCSSET